MSDGTVPAPPNADNENAGVLAQIREFKGQCEFRYSFNNRWDVVLTISGVLLGVGIVAAGVYDASKQASILGAIVTAIVAIQRAFPFAQRAQFYRALAGQASNLETDITSSLSTAQAAAAALKSLRLDFAQQLPRGSSSGASGSPPSGNG